MVSLQVNHQLLLMGQSCCVAVQQQNSNLVNPLLEPPAKPRIEQHEFTQRPKAMIISSPGRQKPLTKYDISLAENECDFDLFDAQFPATLHKTATFNTNQLLMSVKQDPAQNHHLSHFGQAETINALKSPTFNLDQLISTEMPPPKEQAITKARLASDSRPESKPDSTNRFTRSNSQHNFKKQRKENKSDYPKNSPKGEDASFVSMVSSNTRKGILKKRSIKSPSPVIQKRTLEGKPSLMRSKSLYEPQKDDTSQGTSNQNKKKVQFDPKIFRPKNKNFYM